jgi:hypothetical protein
MKAHEIDLALGMFSVLWATLAWMYMRRHPEKLQGMSYEQFRKACVSIILIGLVLLGAAPFIK